MNRFALALLLLLFSSCGTTSHEETLLDHVIIGVSDLDAGISAFESATGVKPQIGGTHPGRGTRNALVSLGAGTYIEIIAPQEQPDAMTDTVRALQSLAEPKLVGWAARVDDASRAHDAIARRGIALSEVNSGSRVTPSGNRLEWMTFGFERPPVAFDPFFIAWSASTAHPSKTAPRGCRLTAFDVVDPNADTLNRAFEVSGIGVRARGGNTPHLTLQLLCGTRTARFSS
jgi:hypothetical protein